jgi:Tripartite tricarboxylate transporter family receptor
MWPTAEARCNAAMFQLSGGKQTLRGRNREGDPPTALVEHIRDGWLRAFAVTSANRFFGLIDVPTIAESGFPGNAVGRFARLCPTHRPSLRGVRSTPKQSRADLWPIGIASSLRSSQ